MKTKRSLEAGRYPVYLERTVGVSVSWQGRAKCKSTEHDVPRFAWTVGRTDKGEQLQGIAPERWIALARTICESCAAQYDCVRFAMQVDERYNTWGLDIEDLRWLIKQAYARQLVETAEEMGVSVHQAVQRARGMA
jgi:hypothetical protein